MQNLDLQKDKNIIKQKIYPFIDEMVDVFYNEDSNCLIEKVIETSNDKSVFLMFIMMYYSIYLKLDNKDKEMKKTQIKILMNELIQDHEKRSFCIEMFASKFQDIFNSSDQIQNNKRLFLENN
jgi:hypothetical protein